MVHSVNKTQEQLIFTEYLDILYLEKCKTNAFTNMKLKTITWFLIKKYQRYVLGITK